MMTFDELCEEYAKADSFMEPQVELWDWFIYEDEHGGTTAVDHDYLHDIPPMCIVDVIEQRCTGYGARLSAPGYMDCTDWVVFDTEQEAIDYLAETYLDQ